MKKQSSAKGLRLRHDQEERIDSILNGQESIESGAEKLTRPDIVRAGVDWWLDIVEGSNTTPAKFKNPKDFEINVRSRPTQPIEVNLNQKPIESASVGQVLGSADAAVHIESLRPKAAKHPRKS